MTPAREARVRSGPPAKRVRDEMRGPPRRRAPAGSGKLARDFIRTILLSSERPGSQYIELDDEISNLSLSHSISRRDFDSVDDRSRGMKSDWSCRDPIDWDELGSGRIPCES